MHWEGGRPHIDGIVIWVEGRSVVYHEVSEAKASILRALGIPMLAYIDDA